MAEIITSVQRSPQQLADSMAELTGQLVELRRRKRAFNADINSQIKELEEQIEMENQQWKKMKTV